MRQPVLLCYNLQGVRAQGIQAAAMHLKVRLRPVNKGEYGLPLSVLCGMEGTQDAPSEQMPTEDFDDEMLVMAFFPRDLVSLFLQTLRRMNVKPVALKAVLTQTNASWNSGKLHSELSREHDALAQQKTSRDENFKK